VRARAFAAPVALALLAGCGGPGATDAGAGSDAAGGGSDSALAPAEDWTRDILSADLALDLTALTGTAAITLAPAASAAVSFEAGGIDVTAVTAPDGTPLPFAITGGQLDVGLPETPGGGTLTTFTVAYGFSQWPGAALPAAGGWLSGGSTMLWPDYCGRLYPCHSLTADGLTFTLAITGVPAGLTAVYPASIPTDAPPYQIAFTVGDYVHADLGVTPSGTAIGVWYFAGEAAAALSGTASLVDYFAFYEATYGPYAFGPSAGVVAVDWGGAISGGFEHHPYWHVSRDAMASAEVMAHEASHGWFGDAVRLRCWEDLVLSEGTASYLEARAVAAVDGAAAGDAVWQGYQNTLDFIDAGFDAVAWPAGCNVVDPLSELTPVPYMKGAFFYRAVELQVGAAALDAALAQVFADFAGEAASMQDVLDAILSVTGLDATALADGWLRNLGHP